MAKEDKAILACEVCLCRNYTTHRSKKNNGKRLELRKYCPHCGKNLHRFYGRNWRTLFAPVPEHHMLGITKGE